FAALHLAKPARAHREQASRDAKTRLIRAQARVCGPSLRGGGIKTSVLSKDNDQFSARVADVDEAGLPEGDVTIRVDYSTINYKDALAITNKSPIVRKWPMVAGIDAAGTVEKSSHPDFKPGDAAILMGWAVGENHWGGLAPKVRV